MDAKTGKVLWKFNVGTGILQSPITYAVGRQAVRRRGGRPHQGSALVLRQDRPAHDRCQPRRWHAGGVRAALSGIDSGKVVAVKTAGPVRPRRFSRFGARTEEVLVRKFTRHVCGRRHRRGRCSLLARCGAGAEEAQRPVNPYAGNARDRRRKAAACSTSTAPIATVPTPSRASARATCAGCKIRYGDDAIVVFYTTVNTGRMDKGMPVWKGVLTEEVMWKIFTFLSSVQTEPVKRR